MLRDALLASQKIKISKIIANKKSAWGTCIRDLEVNVKIPLDMILNVSVRVRLYVYFRVRSRDRNSILPLLVPAPGPDPTDGTQTQAPWRSRGREPEGWEEGKISTSFLLPPYFCVFSLAVAGSPTSALSPRPISPTSSFLWASVILVPPLSPQLWGW